MDLATRFWTELAGERPRWLLDLLDRQARATPRAARWFWRHRERRRPPLLRPVRSRRCGQHRRRGELGRGRGRLLLGRPSPGVVVNEALAAELELIRGGLDPGRRRAARRRAARDALRSSETSDVVRELRVEVTRVGARSRAGAFQPGHRSEPAVPRLPRHRAPCRRRWRQESRQHAGGRSRRGDGEDADRDDEEARAEMAEGRRGENEGERASNAINGGARGRAAASTYASGPRARDRERRRVGGDREPRLRDRAAARGGDLRAGGVERMRRCSRSDLPRNRLEANGRVVP